MRFYYTEDTKRLYTDSKYIYSKITQEELDDIKQITSSNEDIYTPLEYTKKYRIINTLRYIADNHRLYIASKGGDSYSSNYKPSHLPGADIFDNIGIGQHDPQKHPIHSKARIYKSGKDYKVKYSSRSYYCVVTDKDDNSRQPLYNLNYAYYELPTRGRPTDDFYHIHITLYINELIQIIHNSLYNEPHTSDKIKSLLTDTIEQIRHYDYRTAGKQTPYEEADSSTSMIEYKKIYVKNKDVRKTFQDLSLTIRYNYYAITGELDKLLKGDTRNEDEVAYINTLYDKLLGLNSKYEYLYKDLLNKIYDKYGDATIIGDGGSNIPITVIDIDNNSKDIYEEDANYIYVDSYRTLTNIIDSYTSQNSICINNYKANKIEYITIKKDNKSVDIITNGNLDSSDETKANIQTILKFIAI
jgi:hypothetical protein